MMIFRAKSPLRVSFAGGGTDVPPFCYEQGGAVLNATINRYAFSSIMPTQERKVVVHSLDYNQVEEIDIDQKARYNGNLDLVKATLNEFTINEGCHVHLHSDAPPGSGLGASSTMVVSLLGCVSRWLNEGLDAYDLAERAYQIERLELGIAGGYQDQYASAFGGFNFIEFQKDTVIVNPLRIHSDVINELEYNILLCYTGGIRLSANIIKDQVQNYEQRRPDVIKAMAELKELAYTMKRELLKGRLNDFGSLLHDSWLNKKIMSNRISTDHIDELYDMALKKGALGGKLLGAGGGGYLLLYCPNICKYAVIEELEKMGGQFINWSFEARGLQTWVAR